MCRVDCASSSALRNDTSGQIFIASNTIISNRSLCPIARLDVLTSLCIARMYLPRRRLIHRCRVIYTRSCSSSRLYLADAAPHAQNAQEPMRPSSSLQIDPNPAHQGNLCRRPFDHLRQRAPTTSASTRRTGTCASAAATAFFSTTADAMPDPPPPPTTSGGSTSLSPLSAPPFKGGVLHTNTSDGQSSRHRSWRRARRWVYIEDEDSQVTPAACAHVAGAFGFESVISGKRRMVSRAGVVLLLIVNINALEVRNPSSHSFSATPPAATPQEIVRDIQQLGTPPNARTRRPALPPRPRCSSPPPSPRCVPTPRPPVVADTLDVLLSVVPVLTSSSSPLCSASPRVFLWGRERQRTSDIQRPHVHTLLIAGDIDIYNHGIKPAASSLLALPLHMRPWEI
ncbi:hypothetical protein B0H13DRAFT_2465758 [Mycena leptocephala]|nr:hypothetical protein B0H13DRAFT_2465758 [Mycena leptocephala]